MDDWYSKVPAIRQFSDPPYVLPSVAQCGNYENIHEFYELALQDPFVAYTFAQRSSAPERHHELLSALATPVQSASLANLAHLKRCQLVTPPERSHSANETINDSIIHCCIQALQLDDQNMDAWRTLWGAATRRFFSILAPMQFDWKSSDLWRRQGWVETGRRDAASYRLVLRYYLGELRRGRFNDVDLRQLSAILQRAPHMSDPLPEIVELKDLLNCKYGRTIGDEPVVGALSACRQLLGAEHV